MLITTLSPLRRFIATDLLEQNYFNKYTTGYIYHTLVDPHAERPYITVGGVITRIGKNGKARIKTVEFHTAPVVYQELIGTGYYTGITHVLTKIDTRNVLEMTNLDFLAWYYANALYVERLRIKNVWPTAFDYTSAKVRKMARSLDDYSAQEIHSLVGNVMVREYVLTRLRQMYSFIKHYIPHLEDLIPTSMLSRHRKTVGDKKMRATVTQHLALLVNRQKLPEDILTENTHVSKEYEDSGYWV